MTELRLPDINRVLLSGRLTRDPELRYAADGTEITPLELAFNRHYKGRDGRTVEQAGFVTVMTYTWLAKQCAERLHKGSPVLVEGRLQMREWTGPQGGKQKRLELRGDMVHFLEKLPATGAPHAAADAGDKDRLF